MSGLWAFATGGGPLSDATVANYFARTGPVCVRQLPQAWLHKRAALNERLGLAVVQGWAAPLRGVCAAMCGPVSRKDAAAVWS